jgi:hypothetical protein
MLIMGGALNLDATYRDLENEVIVAMTAKMSDKDVWYKVVFIKGVVCSIRQRATFLETESSPMMMTDLAEKLEEANTLHIF